MKKVLLFTILFTFLLATASANLSLLNQPENIYNLKDKIEISIKIIPTVEFSNQVSLYLSCENTDLEVYKEFLILNQETVKEITIPLVKEYINDMKGDCKILSKIGTEEKKTISKTFKISDELILNLETENKEFEPGKEFQIFGTALRENQKPANGVIKATLEGQKDISIETQIKNGEFTLSFDLPENTKAGEHKIELKAYEENSKNQITNHKEKTFPILIKQIPTNLEIILDEKEIIPGEQLKGKILLRDQTGETIESEVYIAIKNELNEIVEKIQITTGDNFKYTINSTQAPSNWTVAVYSEELINKLNFKILANEKVSTSIINKTLVIENIGNVPYNKIVPVKIGDQTLEIKTNLGVGQKEKYTLSAPNGEYSVKIGEFEQLMTLTGRAIDIEKITDRKVSLVKVIAWIFIILVLTFATYILYNSAKKKTFFGKKTGKAAKKSIDNELQEIPQPEKLMQTKTKGQLTLSITGGKQNAPMGCLVLKNYEELRFGQGGVRESLQAIANYIEEKKGIIYENKGNIFFIIPPTKTKTFENEQAAIDVAEFIKKIISEHNKKFKIKIDYGISLNYGTIVSTETKDTFKFMTMGTLITTAKKLANKSKGNLLLGEHFTIKAKDKIKVKKVDDIDDMKAYEFAEMKIKEDHSKFINDFIRKTYNKQ